MDAPLPIVQATVKTRMSGIGASIAVCSQIILLFTLTNMPTPLYRDYAKAYHFSVLTLTLIFATYVAGTLLTLFFLGRLSDQVGRKRVALAAIALAMIAALVFVWIDSVAMLFVARLLTGLAAGLSSGTAIAWMRDLNEGGDEKDAALTTVAVNVFGLGFGPLLSGVLADATDWPLIVPYIAFAGLLLPLAAAIAFTRETVTERKSLSQLDLSPRVGVPSDLRVQFLAPGVTTFVIYSLVGFYAAITPNIIAQTLKIESHAAAGAIVFGLFAVATITVFAGRALSNRTAMISGAALMLPALVFLVLAQVLASLVCLLIGTLIGGLSLGFGWRGALQLTGEMAHEDERAEIISSLFLCGNLGMAVPVIGVGALSAAATPHLANLVFAGVIALISIAGLIFGLTHKAKKN